MAYKTVTDMEWRCCQGYAGDDCGEGPAPALGPAPSTPHPRPRPARPNLSGSSAGSHLSGLGGEGECGGCWQEQWETILLGGNVGQAADRKLLRSVREERGQKAVNDFPEMIPGVCVCVCV